MAITDERLQVLKMIEEGKISVAEGTKLLKALAQQQEATEPLKGPSRPRWFRVLVVDLRTGSQKANVNIPIGLVDVGLRMGARFLPESADEETFSEISRIIESGQTGKVFELVNDAGSERYEIFVE